MQTCSSCAWWDWIAEDRGSCRARAPIVIGGLYGPSETVWPETEERDRCGEHKERTSDD